MECQEHCPREIITFGCKRPVQKAEAFSPSRRQFLGTMAGGVTISAIGGVSPKAGVYSETGLIRPPGALAEEEFLARCVRCGECMQVCIGNALQPSFLEAGITGMFAPLLVARTGYCEYNCTLCGQVCPTAAIGDLSLQEKHGWKIGNVFFDKNRCLPYAKGVPCIVCEEHCPTPEKAILFKEVSVLNQKGERVAVKQPYVIDDLCIGCGICENKCPVPGRSAVLLTNEGEARSGGKNDVSQGYG